MDYNEDLYCFFKQAKINEALLITSNLIKEKAFRSLQTTWIRSIACIGEYTDICFLKWMECIRDIDTFIQNDDFDFCTVLQITVKICILFQNSIQYNVFPKTTITQLRTKTIGYFENEKNNKLSKKGEDFFEKILPKPINERVFILKILSTLIHLWNDMNHIAFRDVLEYLVRKDYTIHTPTGSSIIDFLWDFIKLYEPSIGLPLYTLYKTEYKKRDKQWRNAFLYGIHNYLNKRYNTVQWTFTEVELIENTKNVAKELWIGTKRVEEVVIDKMTIFDTFIPFKQDNNDYYMEENTYAIEPRTIRVRTKN
jgi:hypothetical protein